MTRQNPYSIYNVEFLLSFSGEDNNSTNPYHGNREVVLTGTHEQNEQLKNELVSVVRKYIAGLNEFPEEIVHVEVVKFDKKDEEYN